MIQYFCDTILVMKIHNIIVLQNIDKQPYGIHVHVCVLSY